VFRRLGEPVHESAREAGGVFVSNSIGNLFNRKVAGGKKVCRFPQPSFTQQIADVYSRLLLEQALKSAGTQMYFKGKLTDRVSRPEFD
jgi:hypothetical protein